MSLTIMNRQERYSTGNVAIATMLGWFQEEGQSGTWYEKTDTAIVVAFSTPRNYYAPERLGQDMPFNRDWNFLNKAKQRIVELTGKRIMETTLMRGNDEVDYEINVGTLKSYDWDWVTYKTVDDMGHIDLLFAVIAELSEEYNNRKQD